MKRCLLFFCMMLLTLLALLPAAVHAAPDFNAKIAGMNKLSEVRVGVEADKVRIVVDATQAVKYRSFSLSNPDRVAVDIHNAWLSPNVPKEVSVKGSDYVSKVRISQYNETTVRIVVDARVFRDQIDMFTLSKDPKNKKPYRLVMDFGKVRGPSKKVEKQLEKVQQYIEAEQQGIELVDLDFEIIDEEEEEPLPPKKRPENRTPGIEGKTIIIDPGHGGSDPGALGANGTREKDITLAISKHLVSYLEEAGAHVIATRTTDTDVSRTYATDAEELQARADIGNDNDADLFISIHIDSFAAPEVGGTTVYIYDDARLGKCLHDELIPLLGREDRGVKFGGFHVLKHTEMPAALIELMFISNPKEEKLLTQEETQVNAARGIFEGIRSYFG